MSFSQVSSTTISSTWRITGFTCLLSSTANVVFLIFKWWRCFLLLYIFSSGILSSFALFLGLYGSWILSFHLIKVSEVFFLLSLQLIRSLSSNTVVTLASGLDILERLGLSLLTFISFGCSILVLLSDKMADEIDLDLFIFLQCLLFQLFEKPLIYPITLIYSIIYLCLIHFWWIYLFYFKILVVCLFCLWRQFYFFPGMSYGFLHHIRFFSVSFIPSLTIFL